MAIIIIYIIIIRALFDWMSLNQNQSNHNSESEERNDL